VSHRDVPAACLGVLLPPARALAVLGSGVCASDWRPESCRATAQAGHWVALLPLYRLAIRRPSRHADITRSSVGLADRARGLTGIHQNDWEFDW
jgi:hypothetical protein